MATTTHLKFSPGQWVIWRDPDDDSATQPARVVRIEGGTIFLVGESGSEIECYPEELAASKPCVAREELEAELLQQTQRLRDFVESVLADSVNPSDISQRRGVLNRLLQLELAVSGIRDHDIRQVPAAPVEGSLYVHFTPGGVRNETFVSQDPPARAARSTWVVPPWELEAGEVSLDGFVADRIRDLGDAPAWVRAWHGPFALESVDVP